MQIHVARNGQQLGQFPIEEVNRKLADGTLSPTDLGWHAGAAGWTPLANIDGVTTPSAPIPPTISVAAAAAPSPPPRGPSPMPRPPTSFSSSPPQPVQSYKGMAAAGWILLGLTALLSIVPVLGFAAWILAFIVIPVAFVLAIVILTRGGKTQGILIIVSSVVVLPVFILVASLASTFILGAAVSEHEKAQEKEIVANLRTLSAAKAKWVAQTRVTDGTKVTVAGLAPYLDGRAIKSIVGETYDPRPVGEEPAATLPPTKSLGHHKQGDVITASGSPLETDTLSPPADFEREGEEPAATATPQIL